MEKAKENGTGSSWLSEREESRMQFWKITILDLF